MLFQEDFIHGPFVQRARNNEEYNEKHDLKNQNDLRDIFGQKFSSVVPQNSAMYTMNWINK